MSRMDEYTKIILGKIPYKSVKFDKMLFSKTYREEKCSKDILNYDIENFFCEKNVIGLTSPSTISYFLLMMIIISSI